MKRAAIFSSIIFFVFLSIAVVAQTAPSTTAPAAPAPAPAAKGDFSLSGIAALASTTSAHGITQTPTKSGGGMMSGRVFLSKHTGVELNYAFTKSSQVYTDVHGNYSELQTHIHELTAAYVLRTKKGRFRPFAEGGGGILVFSPVSGGLNCSATTVCSTPANSNDLSFRANQQTRFSLLYTFGTDYPITTHFAARAQYRGFLYKAPDFGVSFFNDGGLAYITEPSIGLVLNF